MLILGGQGCKESEAEETALNIPYKAEARERAVAHNDSVAKKWQAYWEEQSARVSPFEIAFGEARKASMGPNGTFVWNGKTYTTAYYEEVYGLSDKSVVDSVEGNDSIADEVGVESDTVSVEHSDVDETSSE